jgi:hypothetical protein
MAIILRQEASTSWRQIYDRSLMKKAWTPGLGCSYLFIARIYTNLQAGPFAVRLPGFLEASEGNPVRYDGLPVCEGRSAQPRSLDSDLQLARTRWRYVTGLNLYPFPPGPDHTHGHELSTSCAFEFHALSFSSGNLA